MKIWQNPNGTWMTAIIETQTEPDIDALHDIAREALNN